MRGTTDGTTFCGVSGTDSVGGLFRRDLLRPSLHPTGLPIPLDIPQFVMFSKIAPGSRCCTSPPEPPANRNIVDIVGRCRPANRTDPAAIGE